jgi:hypothetical protein
MPAVGLPGIDVDTYLGADAKSDQLMLVMTGGI